MWSKRRWLYGSYMLIAVMRIPARTGFHLNGPACDMRLTLHNVQLSLTKIPHVVLFGVFFLITVLQFDRADRRTMTWSLVATLALGVLVELEEGMTRTGNCRITDVLPDLWGAFIVMALVMGIVIVRSRAGRTPAREQ